MACEPQKIIISTYVSVCNSGVLLNVPQPLGLCLKNRKKVVEGQDFGPESLRVTLTARWVSRCTKLLFDHSKVISANATGT